MTQNFAKSSPYLWLALRWRFRKILWPSQNIWTLKTYILPKSGKYKFGFGKKSFGSYTEIGPWFRFPILKPGFGRTLVFKKETIIFVKVRICTFCPSVICLSYLLKVCTLQENLKICLVSKRVFLWRLFWGVKTHFGMK